MISEGLKCNSTLTTLNLSGDERRKEIEGKNRERKIKEESEKMMIY